jgi:hypothetical protein
MEDSDGRRNPKSRGDYGVLILLLSNTVSDRGNASTKADMCRFPDLVNKGDGLSGQQGPVSSQVASRTGICALNSSYVASQVNRSILFDDDDYLSILSHVQWLLHSITRRPKPPARERR